MLVGFGLGAYLPGMLPLALGLAAVVWAWLGRRLDGLARFGVATVVASPSLFTHGFLVALPALLGLRPVALWLALGITSVAPGLGWWLAIVLVVARLGDFRPAADLGRAVADRLRDGVGRDGGLGDEELGRRAEVGGAHDLEPEVVGPGVERGDRF